MNVKEFKLGVRDALPTGLGYLSIGLAFGMVAAASGLSAIDVGLMSALIYGGSAQFAICALLVSHASFFSIILTIFLVNLRNMLMSLHVTTLFKDVSLLNGLFIGSLVTDESYGVLLGKARQTSYISSSWMHGNNLFSYVTWISATVIGALLGNVIPSPQLFGLDFALVAMFIGLFLSQFEAMTISHRIQTLLYILLGVTVTYFILATIFSQAIVILLATLVGCMIGVLSYDA
ncbi:AzlC family ABC transporter permease [Streptococcus hongkongensis]|nr:hypothetical protein NC01_01030 [Streptococcus uberis]